MFATCPHSKLIANRSIIINGFTGTNNLFDFFPINQSFPLFLLDECMNRWRDIKKNHLLTWMRFQWSQRSHYIKSGPRRSQKYLSTPFVRPASSLSGRGRGEKYSQPVPPYFNELLGILQVGGVFWNLILIGGQRFKINLFICFVHPQKTSKQPIIGNSQSRRKGAPWKIWARPKQSRFEDFKQLITNCRKYMNGVAHRRNGSEFKLIYAVLI